MQKFDINSNQYIKPFLLLFFLMVSASVNASEYQLKVAYIYNIAKFVQWPDGTFASDDAPLNIGIYDDDPLGEFIDSLTGKKIGSHPLRIIRLKKTDNISPFQILYINKNQAANMKEFRKRLSDKAILSISDMGNFISEGGVIRLKTVKNRLRMTINMRAAKKHRLNFSAKLLEIASLVELESDL